MWVGNLKAALASIRTAKWRSTLTMLGIIIGVSSVVTIVSLGQGFRQQIIGQISSMDNNVITVRSGNLVSNEGDKAASLNLLAFLSASTLTDEDINALKNVPSITSITPVDFLGSSASAEDVSLNNIYVIGTSPDLPRLMNLKTAYGGFFEDSNDKNAILGASVAHNLFSELNPIGNSVNIRGQSYVVHGVLKETPGGLITAGEVDPNSSIFIPYDQARTISRNNTNILQIMALSKDTNNPDNAVAQTKSMLLKTHQNNADFTVLKQAKLLSLVSSSVNTGTAFLSGIAAVSLLVAGIGIMDIMLVSVSERTREIGVRKAIGATNRQILNQFLVEGLSLTIVGGAIGIMAALVIHFLLRIYTNLHPALTWPIMLLAVGLSIAVGVIFSVAPAIKAARKAPIDALRGE